MKKWIAWICAASVIALVGCGPDLSTPEGRMTAFWRCADIPLNIKIENNLSDPDSFEHIRTYWHSEQGSLVPLGWNLLTEVEETSRARLVQEDSYPKRVTVEIRASNAFGVSIRGTAVAIVDAVDYGDCNSSMLLLSIE